MAVRYRRGTIIAKPVMRVCTRILTGPVSDMAEGAGLVLWTQRFCKQLLPTHDDCSQPILQKWLWQGCVLQCIKSVRSWRCQQPCNIRLCIWEFQVDQGIERRLLVAGTEHPRAGQSDGKQQWPHAQSSFRLQHLLMQPRPESAVASLLSRSAGSTLRAECV